MLAELSWKVHAFEATLVNTGRSRPKMIHLGAGRHPLIVTSRTHRVCLCDQESSKCRCTIVVCYNRSAVVGGFPSLFLCLLGLSSWSRRLDLMRHGIYRSSRSLSHGVAHSSLMVSNPLTFRKNRTLFHWNRRFNILINVQIYTVVWVNDPGLPQCYATIEPWMESMNTNISIFSMPWRTDCRSRRNYTGHDPIKIESVGGDPLQLQPIIPAGVHEQTNVWAAEILEEESLWLIEIYVI